MLASGTLTATVILQLLFGFVALILAAFCAVCFGAEFAYGVVWWSVSAKCPLPVSSLDTLPSPST
jgi:hypothetical protein